MEFGSQALIYLSGHVSDQVMRAHPNIGVMLTPLMGNRPILIGQHWAADTGCFARPEAFVLERYLLWLDTWPRGACLFATAPDAVGDADRTWTLSRPVLPLIREMGYPAALVAQDGITDIAWDAFDTLFVGGSTEFKLAEKTYQLAQEARVRGKWVHMGRVNSWRRLRAAWVGHYDSVDGTYLRYAPDFLLPKLITWMAQMQRQGVLQLWPQARMGLRNKEECRWNTSTTYAPRYTPNWHGTQVGTETRE